MSKKKKRQAINQALINFVDYLAGPVNGSYTHKELDPLIAEAAKALRDADIIGHEDCDCKKCQRKYS